MAKDETQKEQVKVDTPLPAYVKFMQVLNSLNTLMGGTRAMQNARTLYLPQEKEEELGDYNNRLARTYLVNYFKRTIEKLGGEIFSKPVQVPEEMDEDLKTILDNVDNNGNSVTQFSYTGFKKGLHQGIGHILVDYPQIKLKKEGGVTFFLDEEDDTWKPWTKANEKELNFRPNWVLIDSRQIIGWRTENIQGKETLTQVRIQEEVNEPVGDYGQKVVKRIRVFTPKTWEIHEQDEGGDWELIKTGSNNLGYIPLVTVYLGEKYQSMVVNPPLEGLGDLNIAHWQSTSDQRNILHYARLVVYFGKGLAEDIKIGPNRFILTDEPDADLKVVEHSGNSINAGRQDIVDLETQMSMYGLTYMMPRSGSITATERAIDKSENDSALKAWALSWQDGINNAVKMTADHLGIVSDDLPEVTVNIDFKSFLADQEAKILMEAKEKGIIPRAIVVEEFIRRGIIKDDTDLVELEAMLEKERQEGFEETGAFSSLIARREAEAKKVQEPLVPNPEPEA
ncbi:MAG: DUF4055 domain-containing protein [Actinomycetia bacterium]|nr:DUF4055 domain-containing protein [Actinomycetes bacterium]